MLYQHIHKVVKLLPISLINKVIAGKITTHFLKQPVIAPSLTSTAKRTLLTLCLQNDLWESSVKQRAMRQ